MIQSGKFDSSNMDIKKLANLTLNFLINRLIEIFGILISIFGIILFIALVSYSPSDPNFIFPEETEIKNLLGFHGSYTADFFFQSFGFISYLIPITYFFTGLNIFKKKEIFIIISNTFFIVPYTVIGSIFFDFFYTNAFKLYINGNGGFVGNYFNNSFVNTIINTNENIFYYILIILIIFLFLISINFNLKNFILFLNKIINFIFKKTKKIIQIKMRLLMNIYLKKKSKI